ncbi:MAG: alpha/beta fold hydrolase [Cypionkella sp.]|uniref:RBBP9/YdeN family alpha/beta hydrolase n=1 Tax=Cypionkella sp. TaxID=2811411 RepID=UPI002ABB2398|nr:alpha/beta fold hydrolase [Cypionkella sp.]MDZ4310485.1 alpha/beta fold hydrolase [Cypionkella sp.]
MVKTLLVPGLDGSLAPHWQHWWAATDTQALMVDLSDPARPDPVRWEAELAGTILRHPGAVLVGHSLGAVLIARVLNAWPQLNVRGALLVAPAEPDGQPRIQSFAPIRELPLHVPATVVASRNDPWMRFPRARQLAATWQADLIDLGFAGHINTDAGFGPWPAGKQLRDDLLLQSAPRLPIRHAAVSLSPQR